MMKFSTEDSLIKEAALLIASADRLLITAGAGMGVDSGLPDFRGEQGFWNAYPALAKKGINFSDIANPWAFRDNPKQAWGFYGHRLALYRRTIPHEGFHILQRIAQQMANGCFVITSNVDGQFQKAGFDASRIREIHGSIHRLQCCAPCSSRVWEADVIEPTTDDDRCEWVGNDLPSCPHCGELARPNILMFDDWLWVDGEIRSKRQAYQDWSNQGGNMLTIEMGAGVDIASIRRIGEEKKCPMIRINPRQSKLPINAGIGIAMGALDALSSIDEALAARGFYNEK